MDELDKEIDQLQGSWEAKRQAKIVLRTILGQMVDEEACQKLGVSQSELEELRRGVMEAMVNAVEPLPGEGTLD